MTDETYLEVRDVSVSFRARGLRGLAAPRRITAVDDVSLTVQKGTVLGVIGESGSGKTTLGRAILGLVRPSSGEIRFAGRGITRAAPHRISGMGVLHVPEGRGIFRSLTVRENLQMATYATHDIDPDSMIDQAVAMFPVLGTRLAQLAGTLSGGEQQMLALARAFAARPKLLMLDEISMGLAPKVAAQLFAAIRQAAAGGLSMLLIEQYVDAALELADYGYVMEKGTILDMGEPADLRASGALSAAYLGVSA